ncbi:hypothetical protein V4P56_03695 [Bartonella sp. B35(2025)]
MQKIFYKVFIVEHNVWIGCNATIVSVVIVKYNAIIGIQVVIPYTIIIDIL